MPTERLRGRALQRGENASGFELDHIVALANEGTNDDSNMQILQHQCHEPKTKEDLGYTPKVTTGLDGWPVDESVDRSTAARRPTA